jgi:hypothetical protein
MSAMILATAVIATLLVLQLRRSRTPLRQRSAFRAWRGRRLS